MKALKGNLRLVGLYEKEFLEIAINFHLPDIKTVASILIQIKYQASLLGAFLSN